MTRHVDRDLPLTVVLHDASRGATPAQWRFASGRGVSLGVGRADEMEIQLDDKTLSRLHATISYESDRWIFCNRGLNGSFCDGKRIDQPHVIRDGMEITLSPGGPCLTFALSQDSDEGQAPAPDQENNVTVLIEDLAHGSDQAASRLWELYFRRVAELARLRLNPTLRRVADEEDVAASVFKSLFLGVSEGRFEQLASRENLWRLLSVMTARKAADQAHHLRRAKRGGGQVRGESIFFGEDSGGGIAEFVEIASDPSFQMRFAEEVENRLRDLEHESLRSVAQLKLEGYANEEIAQRLGCTVRTIQRRLLEIRAVWSSESA